MSGLSFNIAKRYLYGKKSANSINIITGISVFGPSNTAYWAHVGGALTGLLLMLYWKRTQFDNNRWN